MIEMGTPSQDLMVAHEADGLAVVTLNRPVKRNAINLAMWQGLKAIFHELNAAPETRAVIVTGSGGNFSAGGDISEFATVRANAEAGATGLEEIFLRLTGENAARALVDVLNA